MTEAPKAKKKKSNQNNISVGFKDELKLQHSNQSSVDIKRNAKGATEFTVKVYSSSATEAAKIAKKVYNDLEKSFSTQ
jgi:hypothetical protein